MLESILRREIKELRELFEDRQEKKVLEEILCELRRIRHQLEPKFTLYIHQRRRNHGTPWYLDFPGDHMAAIVAGQSASFFLTATASDSSTVSLANPVLTADDPNIVIAPDATDALTFTVTVPATDVQATFNLNASADATSNTSATPQSITATLAVTITPSTVPVTFTLAINQK